MALAGTAGLTLGLRCPPSDGMHLPALNGSVQTWICLEWVIQGQVRTLQDPKGINPCFTVHVKADPKSCH